MGILMPETCWVSKKKNKNSKRHIVGFLFFSCHKMDGPINIRFNRCYLVLRKQLRSHYTRINIKLKRYKTLIRHVTIYEWETWAISKSGKNKINAFERTGLRSTYRPIKINGECRIGYNQEHLENQGSEENAVQKRRWGGQGWNQVLTPILLLLLCER